MILKCYKCAREVNACFLDELGHGIFVENYVCDECRREHGIVLVLSIAKIEKCKEVIE